MNHRRRTNGARPVLAIWAWAVFLFLVAPVLIVIPISFSSAQYLQFPPPGFSLRWYAAYFASAPWLSATAASVRIGLATVAIAAPLGTLASFGLVRGRFPGKRALNALLLSPMIVPTIVVAVALYFAFAPVKLVGNWFAVALGHAALAVPLVVINVSAALVSFDENLELAAANLGANRWRAFRHVTFPLIRPGIAAGALFAFLVSFDELLVALFVAGLGAPTLPIKMWSSLQQDVDPTIAAISTLLVAISCLVIFGGEAVRTLAERRERRATGSSPPS
jgi:putative spermidine/putrescine transport system permease protein